MPIPWAAVGKAAGLAGTAFGLADQGKKVGVNRTVKRNLAELFRENFVSADGRLRPAVFEARAAGLRFIRSAELTKDWSGNEYYLVRIIAEDKPGDHPDRVRRLGFFPASMKIGFPPIWSEAY